MKKSQTIEQKADEVGASPDATANEPNAAAPSDAPPATIDSTNVTPEQLEELKTLAAKADENWQRLLRTQLGRETRLRAAAQRQLAGAVLLVAGLALWLWPAVPSAVALVLLGGGIYLGLTGSWLRRRG